MVEHAQQLPLPLDFSTDRSTQKKGERYHKIAQAVGALWLGGVIPKSQSTKTTWKCGTCKAIFQCTYQAIDSRRRKSKYGCPKCGKEARVDQRRLKRSDYVNGALDRGIHWVGDKVPKRNREKTSWQCPNGHTWEAPYHDVVDSKSGCPYCASNTPVTLQDFEAIERETGYRWLDWVAVRSHDKSRWQCHVCGHVWATTLYLLRIKGHGCPECGKRIAGEKGQLKAEDYHAIAKERGVTWLGEAPPQGDGSPTEMLTTWKCNTCGAIDERTYKSIRKSSHGCAKCTFKTRNDNVRLKRENYINAALDRGIRWIGDEVPRSRHTKTLWQCPEGHTWKTAQRTIARGRGCPVCQHHVNGQPTSSQQRELAEILGGEMNVRYEKRRTVDIVIERDGHKVAIEYDGWYWHGSEKMQASDERKYQQVVSLGWKLVRVCSSSLLPSRDQLEQAISEAITAGYAEIVLEDWGVGTVFDRR